MPTLDPRTNHVTIGGYPFTQFADTSTYTLSGEDGFAAKSGVGGTVGMVRVVNPLASLKIDLMQGSADVSVMEGIVLAALATNIPIPVRIQDTLRPTNVISGMARPAKRADDPGIGTDVQTISYEFHLNVSFRQQGASLMAV
jgi:hypothetical protein